MRTCMCMCMCMCMQRASRVGKVVGNQHACSVGQCGAALLRRALLIEVEEVVGLW